MRWPTADAYEKILAAYLVELRAAIPEVMAWWQALVQREIAACGDSAEARERLRARWPFGPGSHPRVLAIYRKHYLAISKINATLLEERELSDADADPLEAASWTDDGDEEALVEHPRTVLLEQLAEVDPRLARIMEGLVFVPIGIDPQGRLA